MLYRIQCLRILTVHTILSQGLGDSLGTDVVSPGTVPRGLDPRQGEGVVLAELYVQGTKFITFHDSLSVSSSSLHPFFSEYYKNIALVVQVSFVLKSLIIEVHLV